MRALAFLTLIALLLVGCTGTDTATDETTTDPMTEDATDEPTTPPPPPAPTLTPTPSPSPSPTKNYPDETETEPSEEEATAGDSGSGVLPPRPKPDADAVRDVRSGPAGDVDLDGIRDAFETSLATNCTLAGRACADLGLKAPVVGKRDFILVQVGRSGSEQNWRYGENVWNAALDEFVNLSIRAQVVDLGLRDDVNASATWEDPANDGKFWVHWFLYDDPAKGEREETAGSQVFNLITTADRESDVEGRATILHESFHAMLGALRGGHSTCANEEIGGPNHSSAAASVLYTSPDCETNDGTVYRLSPDEARELAEEPFGALTEMNAPGWTQTAFEA